jgi:hypothetical protein
MRVCAVVRDLMDRSRLTIHIHNIEFVDGATACANADVVIVDLARDADLVPAIRTAAPHARVVCFGPHVDDRAADQARDDGADVVLPRSRFLRDPAAAITGPST